MTGRYPQHPLADEEADVVEGHPLGADVAPGIPSTSELVARAVLQASTEGILTVLPDGRVQSANPAAERMFGFPSAALVGVDVSTLVPWDAAPDHEDLVATFRVEGTHLMGRGRELVAVRADGVVFPVEVTLTRLALPGTPMVCAMVRDITQRVQLHERLLYQTLHDPLTGLGNRTLLGDRIEHALARLQRRAGLLGVLICDVDRFKAVNDTYGHAAGDALLVELAARMRAAVRPEDTVVRLGGDEFVVLCETLPRAECLRGLARRMVEAGRVPVQVPSALVRTSFSIGGVVRSESAGADDLLRAADRALYQAKAQGRDRAVVDGIQVAPEPRNSARADRQP